MTQSGLVSPPSGWGCPFAKTNRLSPLTLQVSSNKFRLPVGGDPDSGKGMLRFSRIGEASALQQSFGQGPAFLVRVEENPERARDFGLCSLGVSHVSGGDLLARENQSGDRENQSRVQLVLQTDPVYFSVHAKGACPGGTGSARTGSMRVGPDNRRSGYPG